jgi:large subunit ribosomal protein L25
MKTYPLEGFQRQSLGKNAAKELRRAGYVPCALYRPDAEPVHFYVDSVKLDKTIYTPETYLLELSIDGQDYKAIHRDIQFHPVSDDTEHVDFAEARADRPITVELPIQLTGNSPGVLAGGRLVQKASHLRVNGYYQNLPERLPISIAELQLGRSIKVGDLSYDDFKVYMNNDVAVATIEITRALRQEAASAGR